jgi:hypothetical protein
MTTLLDYLEGLGAAPKPKSFKSLSKPGMDGPPKQPVQQTQPTRQPFSLGGGMSDNMSDMFTGWAQGGNDWQRSLALGAVGMSQGRRERAAQQKALLEKEQLQQQEAARLEQVRTSAIAAGIDPRVVSGLDEGGLKQLIATDYSQDRQDAQTRSDREYAAQQNSTARKEQAAKEQKMQQEKLKNEQEMRTLADRLGVDPEIAYTAPFEAVNEMVKKAYADGGPSKPNIDDELKLSKDFDSQAGVKRYREIAPSLASMNASLKDPSAISDLDFVYGVAKILDPNSVVRESEVGLVVDTNSLPEQLVGTLNKVLQGQTKLGPELRMNMYKLARRRATELEKQASSEREFYASRAQDYGFDPEKIFRPLDPLAPDFQGPERPQGAAPNYIWDPEAGQLVDPSTGRPYAP